MTIPLTNEERLESTLRFTTWAWIRRIFLTDKQKAGLEAQHRVERDGRVRDRIKAVLLHSEGWTQAQISQALRIRPETVSNHPSDYEAAKLKPENGGSLSRLDDVQTMQLLVHLEDVTYMRVADICCYVEKQLRDYYPTAKTIHLILNQGPHNISGITKEAAKKTISHRIIFRHTAPVLTLLSDVERS